MITKKYYKLVKVSYADSDYFRVTNVDTTTGTLTINGSNNLGCNIEYSTDGVNWTTAATNAPFSLTVQPGANVYMRGTNSSMNGKTINMDANHNISGNIYSLLDKTNYSTRTVSNASEFFNLFKNNTHLINANQIHFGNVQTVATSSYRGMFAGCTSLVSAPELPATTLNWGSYYDMFNGCSSLTSVKCLAEDISADSCTASWLSGVSATGTFYKSANMSSWPSGASGIPSGWTVVDA